MLGKRGYEGIKVRESELDLQYEKKGYLDDDYHLFYLEDQEKREFENHYHDFDKIIILFNGKVTYTIEGKSYCLVKNDVVLVRHGDIHKVEISDEVPYERLVLYLSPDYLESFNGETFRLDQCFIDAKYKFSNVIRIRERAEYPLYQIMLQMKHTVLQKTDNKEAECLYRKALLVQFLILLDRALKDGVLYYVDETVCNQKIIEMIQYINLHLTEEMNIDTLAERFHLSKYYMMRQFKKETDYTLGNYIMNKRLLFARELIQKGEVLTQVCFTCGFKEYSTFYRAYKKLFKNAPKQERERQEE